jgi:hypothetical protein
MRVRILQRPSGVLEGVTLSAFIPGVSYDVDPLLGSHLVSTRCAEELPGTEPVVILPMDTPKNLYSPFQGGVRVERDTPPASSGNFPGLNPSRPKR